MIQQTQRKYFPELVPITCFRDTYKKKSQRSSKNNFNLLQVTCRNKLKTERNPNFKAPKPFQTLDKQIIEYAPLMRVKDFERIPDSS